MLHLQIYQLETTQPATLSNSICFICQSVDIESKVLNNVFSSFNFKIYVCEVQKREEILEVLL
eukprot:m.334613 g.334613  ORF g.334613 m.334613 type:complete len:63 (-) comp17397_c0_seq1:1053-1241(-)